jgi:hypothetical protein
MRSERERERKGEDDGDGARDEAGGERQKQKKKKKKKNMILAGNSVDRKFCLILVLCKNLESFFTSADSDSWNENRAKACCPAGLRTPEVHKDAEDERGAGLRDCIEVG